MSALKRPLHTQTAEKSTTNDAPSSKRVKRLHGYANLVTGKPKALQAVLTNGVKSKSASRVNESNATIINEINGEGTVELQKEKMAKPQVNGLVKKSGDVQMNGTSEDEEQSFGDMLKHKHNEVITVETQTRNQIVPTAKDAPRTVTGHSLATVLQQALKTNDKDMLESCFRLRDVNAIQNTIERLPSTLVVDLLTAISSRMLDRPGRAGSFMIFLQRALIAHGGYLASHPEALRNLKALHKVIRERVSGLPALLELKGKFDMLKSQYELKSNAKVHHVNSSGNAEGILYIDGQEEESDIDEEVVNVNGAAEDDASEAEDDFNPVQQDDSEDEEEEASQENGILDIEAEETDDDDGDDIEDEDDSDASEQDDMIDDEQSDESEEEIQAPKLQKLKRNR